MKFGYHMISSSLTPPYAAAATFNAASQLPGSQAVGPSQYFSLAEITSILEPKAFATSQSELPSVLPKDRWSSINSFRPMVSSALNKGLSEIIAQNAKDECPIVEIGSGIGYSLSENLSSRLIRTQTSISECQLLRKSISDPIYQLNIEELYNSLIESGKKVPLFFGLHVFDTMLPDERKANLARISKLQDKGDRIVIMLDSNPCLDFIAKELEARFPGHVALPNMPLKDAPLKQSFLMVPVKYIDGNPSDIDLPAMILSEVELRFSGYVSDLHLHLQELKKQLNLKVVMLEDFFVEQMIHDLTDAGYSHKAYYHASFAADTPREKTSIIKQDLLYKPVTDPTGTVRQWSLNDKNLLNRLSDKGLHLPSHFNEAFLQDLRSKQQKILGAEILIIEGIKN